MQDTQARKEEMADEKYIEVGMKQPVGGDGMSDHDRKVMTTKILLKLDFRYVSCVVHPLNTVPLVSTDANVCYPESFQSSPSSSSAHSSTARMSEMPKHTG